LIRLRAGMAAEDVAKVHGHEISHAIDEIAGQISTKGLSSELKAVYNTLNNPNRKYGNPSEPANRGKPYTPEALRYKGDGVPREYIAEAIRAYMANPSYMKTVAPKTAAAIRAAVNPNSTLSKIIQFNTLGPFGLVGAGIAAGTRPDAR
jgi:hypothetical protein